MNIANVREKGNGGEGQEIMKEQIKREHANVKRHMVWKMRIWS